MNDLNTVLLEGRLVRDPELKTLSNNMLCRFSVACSRYFYDNDKNWIQDTSFFHIEIWGAAASICQQVLRKGRAVRVVGRLRQSQWKDKQEIKKELVCIVAEHIEFKPEKRVENQFPVSSTKMDAAMTERMKREELEMRSAPETVEQQTQTEIISEEPAEKEVQAEQF